MIRRFPLAAAACVFALALGPLPASAAPKKPRERPLAPAAVKPSPAPAAETRDETAHLRLWKASDTKAGASVSIRLLPAGTAGGKGAVELAAGAESYQFNSYDDVPAGAGVIEIALAGSASTRLGVNLVKGANCTLLVRVHKGAVAAELIDDALPAGDNAPAFSVYNLMFGGKGEVQVNLGDALTAHLSASGGTLRAQGFKAAFYQITVNGTDSDGQSLRWNAETDLRKVRRTTLIICPDAYGRIRPRLIEDGSPADAASAVKASAEANG